MNPSTLHQLWSAIDETSCNNLQDLSDIDLVNYLLKQLNNKRLLSQSEVYIVKEYIYAKIALIRDLAFAHLIG